jgi:hypothetical protein
MFVNYGGQGTKIAEVMILNTALLITIGQVKTSCSFS